MIGVYGAGGFGREVAAELRLLSDGPVVLIDDDPHLWRTGEIMPYKAFRSQAGAKRVCVAIAASAVRETLVARLNGDGIPLATMVSSRGLVLERAQIGKGSIVCAGAVVSCDASLGVGVHVNFGTYVAHDCRISDYVTFAPHVCCNGNVEIGSHAYVGARAVLKQGTPDAPLRIGANAVIGMGAVVTKDVAEGETVIGVPARPMRR